MKTAQRQKGRQGTYEKSRFLTIRKFFSEVLFYPCFGGLISFRSIKFYPRWITEHNPLLFAAVVLIFCFLPWLIHKRVVSWKQRDQSSRGWPLWGAYWLSIALGAYFPFLLQSRSQDNSTLPSAKHFDQNNTVGSNSCVDSKVVTNSISSRRDELQVMSMNRDRLFCQNVIESSPKTTIVELVSLTESQLSKSPFPLLRSVSPDTYASDVNQEMDRKLADADLSSAYAEEMIATWRDRTNHEFVRNFAVQHLERYARECVVRGTWDPASADAADVRAALEEAVLETGTSVGGAALLALARLSEIDPHVDRTRLGARASSLVSDTSVPAANRASAAQVCDLLRVRSALPTLRSLASDPSVPTPLRLAAEHATKQIEGR